MKLVAEDTADGILGVLSSCSKLERVSKSPEIEFEPSDPVPQGVVLAHVPLALLGTAVEGEEVLTVPDVWQEVVLKLKLKLKFTFEKLVIFWRKKSDFNTRERR